MACGLPNNATFTVSQTARGDGVDEELTEPTDGTFNCEPDNLMVVG